MNHQAYELIINALGGPDAVGDVATDLLKHDELRRCFKEAVCALAEKLDDDAMVAFNRLEYVVGLYKRRSAKDARRSAAKRKPTTNDATALIANNIGKACVALKLKPPLIF